MQFATAMKIGARLAKVIRPLRRVPCGRSNLCSYVNSGADSISSTGSPTWASDELTVLRMFISAVTSDGTDLSGGAIPLNCTFFLPKSNGAVKGAVAYQALLPNEPGRLDQGLLCSGQLLAIDRRRTLECR
jgi:hypothetical protein